MPINSTPGHADANSYVSVAEADSYFSFGKKAEIWVGVEDTLKEALLQEATRLLDQFFAWSGTPTTEIQGLRWPRIGAYDEDNRLIADGVIPKAIKYGTYEWAIYIKQNGDFDVEINGVDVLRVGPIRIDFKDGITENSFPKMVIDLVSSVGSLKSVSTSNIGQPKLVRT